MSHYISLGSTFIPCPRSYYHIRLGHEFQTKRNPYTRRILIIKENIKLPPLVTDEDTTMDQSTTFMLFFGIIGRPHVIAIGNIGTGHRHEHIIIPGLSHIQLFSSSASFLHRQLLCRLATVIQPADLCFINSRYVSKDVCPETVSTEIKI